LEEAMAEIVNLNDVEVLEQRAQEWHDSRASSEAADDKSEHEMQRVRAEHSRGGISLATDAALAEYEETWRKNFDRETLASGSTLEFDLDVASQRIADRITASEELKAPQEAHGVGTQNFLLGSILEELQVARIRGDLTGLTRQQLVDAYTEWKDDRDTTRVRLLETAVLSNGLQKLGVKDDPATDALAVTRLRNAVTERRRKRVEPWLYEAQERLSRIKSQRLDFTMRHLRSGRGIASRPSPKRVPIGGVA
jgi:hypothetical protein